MTYITRPMHNEDIPQTLQIDKECFPTQWPHPTYNSLKYELRNRFIHYLVVCKNRQDIRRPDNGHTRNNFWQRLLYFKLPKLYGHSSHAQGNNTDEDYILGMVGMWIMLDEAHITTIAVRDNHRRRGIGEFLLIAGIDLALELNAKIVTLEVRVSNKIAQALYEKYSFKPVGTRRRYYSDNGEDATIMNTDEIQSTDFLKHLQELRESHYQKWGEAFSYHYSAGS